MLADHETDEFGGIDKHNPHWEGSISWKFECLVPVTSTLKSLSLLKEHGILLFGASGEKTQIKMCFCAFP